VISPIQAYTESLAGDAAKCAASLHDWQMRRAWEVLHDAKNKSPFYAERFSQINKNSNWAEVPTTSAKDLSDPFSLLCVPAHEVARIVTLTTSGTQKQKRILFSKEDLEATVSFFTRGMSTMVYPGQHVAVLMRGVEPYTIGDLLSKGLSRIGVTSEAIFPFDDDVAGRRQKAEWIVGRPGPARRISRKNPRLRPETVLLSADYVPQSVISGIEKLWSCRVLTHYGMTETGYGYAVQCLSKKGYHMRDAEFLCEILTVEGQKPVSPGEYGEVVLTTLSRRAMPLIRYKTGDIARLIPRPCECGATLWTLDKVKGRTEDENALSMPALDEIVFALENIYDMRATTADGLKIIIECALGTEDDTRKKIGILLKRDVKIEFSKLPMQFKKRQFE
jgi:phenylacetate-CoA ligase